MKSLINNVKTFPDRDYWGVLREYLKFNDKCNNKVYQAAWSSAEEILSNEYRLSDLCGFVKAAIRSAE